MVDDIRDGTCPDYRPADAADAAEVTTAEHLCAEHLTDGDTCEVCDHRNVRGPTAEPDATPDHHEYCSKGVGPREDCHVCRGFDALPAAEPDGPLVTAAKERWRVEAPKRAATYEAVVGAESDALPDAECPYTHRQSCDGCEQHDCPDDQRVEPAAEPDAMPPALPAAGPEPASETPWAAFHWADSDECQIDSVARGFRGVAKKLCEKDAATVVHRVNNYPALHAHAVRLQAEVERLRGALPGGQE